MKLRVICQVCGETAILDTNERGSKWDWHDATNFSKDEKDWEFWLCGNCKVNLNIGKVNTEEILNPEQVRT